MKISFFAHWRANFITGMAVLLPAFVSVAVLIWLFGTLANFTDALLIFLPRRWTHHDGGAGAPLWYASVAAFVLSMLMVSFVGMLARHYIGRKLIAWVDSALLAVPLLNKIYGATKQIKEAVSANNKTSFRTAVLVEFPRQGIYSLGFITSEQKQELQLKTAEHVVSVFVPTTPNPTSGFLVLVPESQLTKLDIPVSEAIKHIISLGSVTPDYQRSRHGELVPQASERSQL